jgi:predicted GIY-YIG superfamily endonuclease
MVYILEFSQPVGGRARYYIGWAQDEYTFAQRLKYHKKGRGARLTAAAVTQGITFRPVVIVPEGTRADERRLKSWKKTAQVVRSLLNKGYSPCL